MQILRYHRHCPAPAQAPPMMGATVRKFKDDIPTTLPRAQSTAIIPRYIPRSAKGTKSVVMTSTRVISPPPPVPCTALLATSMTIDELRAQRMEPVAKTMITRSRVCLRPKISDMLPHTTIRLHLRGITRLDHRLRQKIGSGTPEGKDTGSMQVLSNCWESGSQNCRVDGRKKCTKKENENYHPEPP